jgi:hypothetical protein
LPCCQLRAAIRLNLSVRPHKGNSMAYLAFAFICFSWGLGLCTSETGLLMGSRLPINFGEYKNVVGLILIGFSVLLFRAGVRHLRNMQ